MRRRDPKKRKEAAHLYLSIATHTPTSSVQTTLDPERPVIGSLICQTRSPPPVPHNHPGAVRDDVIAPALTSARPHWPSSEQEATRKSPAETCRRPEIGVPFTKATILRALPWK